MTTRQFKTTAALHNSNRKQWQETVSMISVSTIYGSAKICTITDKEAKAFIVYNNLLQDFLNHEGVFSTCTQYAKGQYTSEEMRSGTSSKPLTAHNIWEKGMTFRRELTTFIAKYGKMLKFTKIKPVVGAGETANTSDFDLIFEVPSGGGKAKDPDDFKEMLEAMRQQIYDDDQKVVKLDDESDQDEENNKALQVTPTNAQVVNVKSSSSNDKSSSSDKADIEKAPASFQPKLYVYLEHWVVRADAGKKCPFAISFLIAAGSEGLSANEIEKKSRKQIQEDRR